MNIALHALEWGRKLSPGRLGDRLLFLCLSGLVCSAALASPARIDKVHGDVEIRAVGALTWRPVTPGQKVAEGSAIRTGSDSQADVLTEQGHHFTLRSETTLEFTTLQADETKTHLENGRVYSKVHKLKSNERFALQTPTAVCAVRGTEFDTTAGQGGTFVSVYRGVVGVAALGSHDEIRVPAGQMISVHNGTLELPRPIPKESHAATDTALSRVARHEVGLDMSRNDVIAAAAMEMRQADYREGKSLIDVNGKRVRVDEYIVRPQPNQFKLVVLDKRDAQLDYFFYQGTFNQTLPADLSIALKDLSGTIGTAAPGYYLTAYEMGQSNTRDSIHDTATGGHLVQVSIAPNGDYVLTDPSNPNPATNTRTIPASQPQFDTNGAITGYQIYNPLADNFVIVAPNQVTAATKFGVYISENDSFKDLVPGDTLWKTRFNSYSHQIDNVTKIAYNKSGVTNILASNLDAAWSYAGGTVRSVVEMDANNLDATITNYYGDTTKESYRTVLIDDHGGIAPQSAFSGISTGAAYKGELLKWNYEQQVSATEFKGRKIDLVVEPKIFIKSGLIQ